MSIPPVQSPAGPAASVQVQRPAPQAAAKPAAPATAAAADGDGDHGVEPAGGGKGQVVNRLA